MIKRLSDINMKSIWAFSAIITILLIANAAKQIYGEESPINSVILEGLNGCWELESDSCLGVMHTLDNICKVAYFPACFEPEKWDPMMDELKKIYEHEGKDPYVTLNNEHFGQAPDQ